MGKEFGGYSHLDKWTAALLVILVILLSAMGLDRGHHWGDDFAAYMLEGIAIAEGRLDEQIVLNNELHPSLRDFGGHENEDTLVYVWGLPLILSTVYRMVGYDMPLGEQIIWYKAPGVLCMGILGAVLFLFYRRRMSYGLSLFLTGLIALNRTMISETNHIMTDIPCLTAGMCALLLLDFILAEHRAVRRAGYALLLGISLWFAYVVRLNGVTIVAVVLLGHVIELCCSRIPVRKWAAHACPYMVFLLLLGISSLCFPPVTSNTDHIASGPNYWIMLNIRHYNQMIRDWLYSMATMGLPMKWYPMHILLYVLVVRGMLRGGLRSMHLSIFLAGTAGVLILLPYYQDLRYLYNILPILLLYAGYGAMGFGADLRRLCGSGRMKKGVSILGAVWMIYIGLCNVGSTVGMQVDHLRTKGTHWRYGAYSQDACDMYDYIWRHTGDTDKVAFFKPRALYLNTGRISFVPGLEGRKYEDADYLLISDESAYVYDEIPQGIREDMTIAYQNGTMKLYQINEPQIWD